MGDDHSNGNGAGPDTEPSTELVVSDQGGSNGNGNGSGSSLTSYTAEELERFMPTEEQALERWPDLSEDERHTRMFLSARARLFHSREADSSGRRVMGGPQPGAGSSRRRKRRLGETVAELATGDYQDHVIEALFAPIVQINPDTGEKEPTRDLHPMTRHKAAVEVTRIQREEDELKLREEEFDQKSDLEIRKNLARELASLQKLGVLPDFGSGGVIEGHVVDET